MRLPLASRKLALHACGEEGGLADAAGLRFFDGLLHRAAEGFLAGGEVVDVGDAIGGVVEGVAFGGDPGHLGRFLEEDLVVGDGGLVVLALEDFGEDGKELRGLVDGERALLVEFGEERFGFGCERVVRGGGDACDGGLEVGREAVDVELADEELGEFLGVLGLRVRAAGHLEALERVGAVEGVAERAKGAGDGLFSCGDLAHAGEQDGADGAVVVHDLAAFAEAVVGVGFGVGDAPEEVFEEEHVERLRDAGAGDGGRRSR